jgi:type III pantothenate kinase
MILLIDIGNTNTHLGVTDGERIVRHTELPTRGWLEASNDKPLRLFAGATIEGASICSVVPKATPLAVRTVRKLWHIAPLVITCRNLKGVGIDYPRPETIGPDRLANAVAARKRFGAPSVVVDFGTAVTFDVVDVRGRYVGGIIAPGLAAMTDYLHERTALLPRIRIRDIKTVVGKSTEQAMLIGAVHGYRGLIRGLVQELKVELKTRRLPVVATGGYAALMAAGIPEITAVDTGLTLEGLRLEWLANREELGGSRSGRLSRTEI